jgi:hypothetical protein
MKRALMCLGIVALVLLACSARLALAGPNAGGILLVHYKAGTPVPQDPTFVDGGLTDCAHAITQAPASVTNENTVLWYIYAAFPPNAQPRVSVVSFGCQFNSDLVGINWAAGPPGSLELRYEPVAGTPWPYPGTGTLLGLASTMTGIVDEIYCFAGYGPQSETFGLGPNPDPHLGGVFADDGTPSLTDPIVSYGSLGFGINGTLSCPPPAPTGACCRGVDGACEVIPAGGCTRTGDLYQGNNVSCPPDGSCNSQSGACCKVIVDGACQILSYGACAAQGGRFNGFNSTCTPGLCPPILGACCRGGGEHDCVITVQEDCVYPDANFAMRQPCEPNFCVWGACCNLHIGVCQLARGRYCVEIGNRFEGTGTVCDPNPCPQPGACCVPGTGDCWMRGEIDCIYGDVFLGPGIECQDPNDPNFNPCPEPATGACCNLESGACTVSPRVGCEGLYPPPDSPWVYGGDNTTCTSYPCTPLPAACCTVEINGACELRTRDSCARIGGLWKGLNSVCADTSCADSLGACCANTACTIKVWSQCPEWCVFTPLQSCLPGWQCLPKAACCTIWENGGCAVVTRQQCNDAGGVYFAAISSCEPGDSPCLADTLMNAGSCCYLDGLCRVATESSCALMGGSTWTANRPCTPDRCAETPATAACCTVVPELSCVVGTRNQCLDAGGLWMGLGSLTCSPSPCPAVLGSCCMGWGDGICAVTVLGDCPNPYIWRWEEICHPNPCGPVGACCFVDESCRIVTPAQCAAYGGLFYLGHGTICEVNPCPNSAAEGPAGGSLFSLQGATPNPSSGPTAIRYQLAQDGAVRLEIFDTAGRLVRVAFTGQNVRGLHSVDWDTRNEAGQPLPAGVYFIRLSTGQGRLSSPLILLR